MKVHKLITIDVEVWNEAEEKGLNFSGTVNNVMKAYFANQKPEAVKRIIPELPPSCELLDLAKEMWRSEFGKLVIIKSREKAKGKREIKEINSDKPIHEANQELYDKATDESKKNDIKEITAMVEEKRSIL